MIFRKILKGVLIFLPWLMLLCILPFKDFIPSFGIGWLVISPFWAMLVAFLFYWEGKAIAVIDTARDVLSTVQDNKHHAVNAFNFVKSKVNK